MNFEYFGRVIGFLFRYFNVGRFGVVSFLPCKFDGLGFCGEFFCIFPCPSCGRFGFPQNAKKVLFHCLCFIVVVSYSLLYCRCGWECPGVLFLGL